MPAQLDTGLTHHPFLDLREVPSPLEDPDGAILSCKQDGAEGRRTKARSQDIQGGERQGCSALPTPVP